MTESATLSSALAAIVTEQYLLADPAACAAYAIQGFVPACVGRDTPPHRNSKLTRCFGAGSERLRPEFPR